MYMKYVILYVLYKVNILDKEVNNMKRHFDLIVCNDADIKTVIRFYPRQSIVFNEYLTPNNWEDVCKTYMTFSILNYYWADIHPSVMFKSIKEDGEGLRYLRDVLKYIIDKNDKKKYRVLPFGDGAEWIIERNRNIFTFNVFAYFYNNGFRFTLHKNKIKEFYNVLNEFLEYMLEHSETI